MDAVGTDSARMTMLALAVARVPRDELKAALARTSDPSFTTPTAVGNALNALARHRDPAALVGRPQYRAALPYLAVSIADSCLARTIEALGEHSDDPTRSQLLEALDDVGASFADTTIAVMLAYVAHGDMPSATLCYELLDTDPRFGLEGTGSIETESTASASATGSTTTSAAARATPEQSDARRAKKGEGGRRPAEAGRGGPPSRGAGAPSAKGRAFPGPATRHRVGSGGEGRRARRSTVGSAGHAHPGRGSRVRPRRPVGVGGGVCLGALRHARAAGTRGRREGSPLRGGGRFPHSPSGPAGLLRGRGEEPRLEDGGAAQLEAGGLRPADLDRCPHDPNPAARGGRSGRLAHTGGLECDLVAPVSRYPSRP